MAPFGREPNGAVIATAIASVVPHRKLIHFDAAWFSVTTAPVNRKRTGN
jgi:hypothetical protein